LRKNQVLVPDGHNYIPALHIATTHSHSLTIKALVDSRLIDVFARDKSGNMALHYSATMA
jgi:ankyrin repeat protein